MDSLSVYKGLEAKRCEGIDKAQIYIEKCASPWRLQNPFIRVIVRQRSERENHPTMITTAAVFYTHPFQFIFFYGGPSCSRILAFVFLSVHKILSIFR